jgi:membrane-associated protease RseP (regulator of RpoE activity)
MWFSLVFILILSGILTYIVLRRTVSRMTKVPLWVLWAILMTPPFLTGATVTWSKQIPALPVAVGLCSICWFLYWRVLDWGKHQVRALEPRLESAESVDEGSIELPEISPAAESLVVEETPLARPIEPEEEAILRTCFAWNIFFLDKIEYRPQAVLFRGKLRTDANNAYATISHNIEELFGDRFFILFQYSLSTGKPFFALVPRPQYTKITRSRKWLEYAIALMLLLVTLLPTTYFGAALTGLLKGNMSEILMAGLPYALSIISILGLRDLGRYFVAKYYKIDTNLPYFIPLPFLPGTYGCLVQMRSPIPDRKAVFDLGFVAASLGLVMAIPLLTWGLSQSQIVPIDLKATLFSFHAFNPRFSLLLTLLSKLALGSQFVAEKAIDLNNVAIAAYTSLLIITINLMPLRRLDGGYIVHAMFGQKPSAIVSQLSKVVLLILGFIRFRASGFGNTDLLFLAIVISLIPAIDEPALNDVSELNSWRDALGVVMLAILVLTLIPVPTVLMQLLNV